MKQITDLNLEHGPEWTQVITQGNQGLVAYMDNLYQDHQELKKPVISATKSPYSEHAVAKLEKARLLMSDEDRDHLVASVNSENPDESSCFIKIIDTYIAKAILRKQIVDSELADKNTILQVLDEQISDEASFKLFSATFYAQNKTIQEPIMTSNGVIWKSNTSSLKSDGYSNNQLIGGTLVGAVMLVCYIKRFSNDYSEARKQQRNDKELKKKNVVLLTLGNEVTALGNCATSWKDSFVGLFASAQKKELDAESEFEEFEEDFSDDDSAE
ncbi:hypothetical protein JKY79_03590 [Candidatus Babeliales bacterium]|nr:hypothetical protein [Candidatus Babeliales bacterium]